MSSTVVETKENGDMEDRLNSKYWIEGGIEVVHRNHITALNKDRIHIFKMTVDKVIKKSKECTNGQRKTFIEGVRCHWLDDGMKYQVGQFHTNELVPYKIAEKGVEAVNKWLARVTFTEDRDKKFKKDVVKG